jgi:hypothetical protein
VGLPIDSLRRPKSLVMLMGDDSPNEMAREGEEMKPPGPARSCMDLDASRRRSDDGAALMGVSLSRDMRDEVEESLGKGRPEELLFERRTSARLGTRIRCSATHLARLSSSGLRGTKLGRLATLASASASPGLWFSLSASSFSFSKANRAAASLASPSLTASDAARSELSLFSNAFSRRSTAASRASRSLSRLATC